MHASESVDSATMTNLAGLNMKAKMYGAASKAYGAVLAGIVVGSLQDLHRYVSYSLALGIALLQGEAFHDATHVLQRALRMNPVDLRVRLALAQVELAAVLRAVHNGIPVGANTDAVCSGHLARLNDAESTFQRVLAEPGVDPVVAEIAAKCAAMLPGTRNSLEAAAARAKKATKRDAMARDQFKRSFTDLQTVKENRERDLEGRRLSDLNDRKERALALQQSLMEATLAQGVEPAGRDAQQPRGTTTAANRIQQAMMADDDIGGDIVLGDEEDGDPAAMVMAAPDDGNTPAKRVRTE